MVSICPMNHSCKSLFLICNSSLQGKLKSMAHQCRCNNRLGLAEEQEVMNSLVAYKGEGNNV